MLNDRDDKPEGHDESEYHFSDDEVNYEVETDSPKRAESTGGSRAAANLLNRITRSKRMLISLGVFFVLVFIVYKMVAPSSVPSTTITPAQPIAQNNTLATQPTNPADNANAMSPANGAQNQAMASAQAPQQTPQNNMPAIQQQPANQMSQNVPAQAMMPSAQQTNMQQTAQPQNMVAPAQALPSTQPPQNLPQQQAMQMPPQQTITQTQQAPAQAEMPAMIPVESAATSNPNAAALVGQIPSNVQSAASVISAQNDRVVTQLEAEYQQKLNDFASQNKVLQDQLQTLNARVAGMENQMNQMMQVLMRQGRGQAEAPPPPTVMAEPPQAALPQLVEVPHVSYNVQAIIPGRAWLRSDNGETLTVAEGDAIRDLGRVTKIDPYDGVVEINTGSKVISLSYGSGT